MIYRSLDLLVIGGASLDVYHLTNGQTVHSPGGAGLYTALAAACTQAERSNAQSKPERSNAQSKAVRTGMFAPRPDPMPEPLKVAAERIAWLGPTVPPDQLPSFEIAHYGGGRATLLNASWGGEMSLTPENFPNDQVSASIVHIAALRTAERQLNFAKAMQMRNADFGMLNNPGTQAAFGIPTGALRSPHSQFRISAGTYGKICAGEPEVVRKLISLCDFFFLNENEATLLFGGIDQVRAKPGQIIFVTLAERGARVIQGDHVTPVPGRPADEFDPTGAGDTFCGATLAHLARGEHPVMAAQAAVLLSAEMIGSVGPTRLLSDRPAPVPSIDPRARVDDEQVQRIAQLIAQLPDVQPFRFVGDFFPYVDDPGALEWFFAATLQQFGFWEMRQTGHRGAETQGDSEKFDASAPPPLYSHPLIAMLDGRSLKGSDYLFAAYRRMIDRDGGFFSPRRQAALTTEELAAVLRADDGSNPMPAFDLHLEMARSYGRDLLALGWTPREIVEAANRAESPRAAFLSLLDHIGGYKEDPLRKKAMLLALILEQRPEQFLRPAPGEDEPPVIDYHLMRSCLRTGLVDVLEDNLRRKLLRREELLASEEWAVRFAAYHAIRRVQSLAGRGMGAVDWFFFNARRRCPEMIEPDCANCAIDAACAHRKSLFQPVRRTTFY